MKTVPLILPENPSGFRSIPSTEQRLENVERKIDQVVAKLDMILDSMTKPTQYIGAPAPVEGEFTFSVPKSNIAPGIMDVLNKAKEPLFKQPAQSVEQEPKRLIGPPAKTQITKYIEQQPGGMAVFKKLAAAGFVSARIRTKPAACPPSHRYTHTVIIRNSASGLPKFEPTLFGITEAREVVAYLESLGVNVNTSALDNK